MEVKPTRALLFLVCVLAPLLVIMFVAPQNGVPLSETFSLKYPTASSFFFLDTASRDIESLIAEMDEPEEKNKAEEEKSPKDGPVIEKANPKKIQYPDNDKSLLFPVFRALDEAGKGDRPVRVMHYGDSQIEGDRMTGVIRNTLQEKFGGFGPGLVPLSSSVPPFTVKLETSDNWHRYTAFGNNKEGVEHNRYGPLLSFARFSPLESDTSEKIGWVKVLPSKSGYARNRSFTRTTFYYGNNASPLIAQLFADGAMAGNDSLPGGKPSGRISWNIDGPPAELTLILRGTDSPDCYGLSLESPTGVIVDNIALRGNSGTHFATLGETHLRGIYDQLNIKLLLLQFGGNVMPYIEDEQEAVNYGKHFGSQIALLKRLIPDVAVIVIGPSDMSTKENGTYITYPHLPSVRDALKKAAFENGACYFDIYEVMGGKNSMPLWVNAKPPLAATDYVHFSQEGARKVAKVFMEAFMEDYAQFRESQKTKEIASAGK